MMAKKSCANKSSVRQNRAQNKQAPAKASLNQTSLFENSHDNNQVILKSTGEVNLNSLTMVHYDDKIIQQMTKKADVCEPVSTRVQKPMYFNFLILQTLMLQQNCLRGRQKIWINA